MTPAEQEVIDRLRSHYDSIHDNFDSLLQACADDTAAKRQLGDAMQEALENYIEAQNRILNKSAPTIAKLNKAATDGQTKIAAALANLQQIKKVLNQITEVVKKVGILVAAL